MEQQYLCKKGFWKTYPSAINSHLLRKITEVLCMWFKFKMLFIECLYVTMHMSERKQTSTSAPLNAVMMIQCLWTGQSNCLAGPCTIEGKGTDCPWHIQNMAVALGFHPNQMQNNAVNAGHLLTSGTSFPIAFVYLPFHSIIFCLSYSS